MRSLPTALALLLVACGASPGRPSAAPASPSPSPEAGAAGSEPAPPAPAPPAPAPPTPAGVPTTCASPDSPVCVPDGAFVKRLCSGSFPDVALVLLGKETPFARMYMKGDVDGWNADGGASARARLKLDEEMLVLRRRAPSTSGIVVGSGGASYLVMRWDGNCYTLEDGEISARRPAAPRSAPIPWRLYGERTKDALLRSPKILAAYQRRGKECKGAISGEVTRACEQADAALSAAVVTEIRGGLTVPAPERVP